MCHHKADAFKTLLLRISSSNIFLAVTSWALFPTDYKAGDNPCVPRKESAWGKLQGSEVALESPCGALLGMDQVILGG